MPYNESTIVLSVQQAEREDAVASSLSQAKHEDALLTMADKINGAKRKFRKYLPILTIGCMVLAGIAIIKFKNGGVKVTTEVAQIRTIAKTISASGETAVLENYVQRALVGGTIKEIKFISGDDVFKGDSILSYDRDSLKSSLDSTYTSYLSAKSDLESYNQKVVSAKATRNIRKQERDEAWRTYMSDNGEDEKQAYKNAEALYQAAISAYVTLEKDKDYTQEAVTSAHSAYTAALNNYTKAAVHAPSSGKLALNDIHTGSLITSGQELFSITNTTNLIFKAQIDEADISHLTLSMPAKVSLDSYPDKVFTGTVQQIDAKVVTLSSGSAVVIADVYFDATDILPIVAMNGSVDIEFAKQENMLSISPDAVVRELDKAFVYTVEGAIAKKLEVQVGLEGDDYTSISAGLSEGSVVITSPGEVNLTDGAKVRL